MNGCAVLDPDQEIETRPLRIAELTEARPPTHRREVDHLDVGHDLGRWGESDGADRGSIYVSHFHHFTPDQDRDF